MSPGEDRARLGADRARLGERKAVTGLGRDGCVSRGYDSVRRVK